MHDQLWLDNAIETGGSVDRSIDVKNELKAALVAAKLPGSIFVHVDVNYLRACDLNSGYSLVWLDVNDRPLCPVCAFEAGADWAEGQLDPNADEPFNLSDPLPLASCSANYDEFLTCGECNQPIDAM